MKPLKISSNKEGRFFNRKYMVYILLQGSAGSLLRSVLRAAALGSAPLSLTPHLVCLVRLCEAGNLLNGSE